MDKEIKICKYSIPLRNNEDIRECKYVSERSTGIEFCDGKVTSCSEYIIKEDENETKN